MMLRSIVGLVVFSSVTTLAQQPPPDQCDLTSPEVTSMTPSFGGMSGFYSIAKGISDGLQNTPSAKTYDDLNNVIFGNGAVSYNQVIQDMVVNQIGAIIFWSFGFVFVLAALVLGIATCVWQCCYSCVPKETSVRSEITGYVYAFLLFTTFAFILTGLILFNVSETSLISSLDSGDNYTDQISGDLNNVISNGSAQLTCEVSQTTTLTFNNINGVIGNYSSNVVDATVDEVGISAVNNFNDTAFSEQNQMTNTAAQDLKNALAHFKSNDATCKTNIKTLNDQFATVQTALPLLSDAAQNVKSSQELWQINNQVSIIKSSVQKQATAASGAISNTQVQINQSMQSITNMLVKVQNGVNKVANSLKSANRDLSSSSGYSAAKIGVRLGVTIPVCIGCCFCILAFVAVVFSLQKKNGIAIRLATAVIVSFYITILISIILLLFSSLAFVLGWFTSAMCVPIFGDSNYQLFRLMNETIAPVGNGSPDVINIGEILYQCNSPQMTIYTAINGTNIISADSINSQLNLNSYRDQSNADIMSQNNLSFPIDNNYPVLVNETNLSTTNAQSADLKSCGDDAIEEKYQVYYSNLDKSNKQTNIFYDNLKTLSDNCPKTTTIAKQNNDNSFNQGNIAVNQSVSDLINNLETNVFKCRPLLDVYNNAGSVMCDQIGRPIQGLWASIGLAGIFLFFLAILLLLVYRWLKTNSRHTAGEAEYSYGPSENGKNRRNKTPSTDNEDTWDIFAKPAIASTSHTGGRLPRVRPYDVDDVQPSEYNFSEEAALAPSRMLGVQVLPDDRHPYMSPNFFENRDYETRPRFKEAFDDQSNNGSTARGLRRF